MSWLSKLSEYFTAQEATLDGTSQAQRPPILNNSFSGAEQEALTYGLAPERSYQGDACSFGNSTPAESAPQESSEESANDDYYDRSEILKKARSPQNLIGLEISRISGVNTDAAGGVYVNSNVAVYDTDGDGLVDKVSQPDYNDNFEEVRGSYQDVDGDNVWDTYSVEDQLDEINTERGVAQRNSDGDFRLDSDDDGFDDMTINPETQEVLDRRGQGFDVNNDGTNDAWDNDGDGVVDGWGDNIYRLDDLNLNPDNKKDKKLLNKLQ